MYECGARLTGTLRQTWVRLPESLAGSMSTRAGRAVLVALPIEPYGRLARIVDASLFAEKWASTSEDSNLIT